MAYETDALLDLLFREFDFERAKAFEFGWCNVLEAEDRTYKRPVYIYYPTEEVWSDNASRKSLTRQMTEYDKMEVHECLPQAIELLTGKKAAGGIALVTGRSVDANLTEGERLGEDLAWENKDTFTFPQKLGAARRIAEAFGILHEFGMVHGSVGFNTMSVRRRAEKPLIRVDLLNFSEVGEKLPDPSRFFEPAFEGPELLKTTGEDATEVANKTTDVYGLAKFLIYVLIGPRAFIDFFVPSQDGAAPDENLLAKLFDHVLWTNIAQREPELGAQRLEALGGGKLETELTELLERSVRYDPDVRPSDGSVFFHGMSSVMSGSVEGGGGAPAMGGGDFVRPRAESDGPNYALFGGIAAAVVLALGGGWYFIDQNNKQKAQETLVAQTAEACGGFSRQVASLADSSITQLSEWSEVSDLKSRVEANGRDQSKLTESRDFCRDGNKLIGELRVSFIDGLKAQATSEVEFAEASGTDLAPIDVPAKLAEAAKAESDRNFSGLETALTSLISQVVSAHGAVLDSKLSEASAEAERAQAVIGGAEPNATIAKFLEQASGLMGMEATSEGLRDTAEVIEGLNSSSLGAMGDAVRDRVGGIQTLSEQLVELGAGKADTGFSELLAGFQAVTAEELPGDVAGFTGRFQQLDQISDGMSAIQARAAQLEADLPALKERVEEAIKTAETNGWEDEGKLPQIISQIDQWEPASLIEDSISLSGYEAALNEQIQEVSAVWDEGRAVCSEVRARLDAVDNVRSTSVWGDIEPLIAATRDFGGSRATREMFAECGRTLTLVGQAELELRAQDLVAEMQDTQKALEEKGLGDFIVEFASAKSSFETLLGFKTPTDEATYAAFAQQAEAAITSFDEAEASFDAAVSSRDSLASEFADMTAKVEASDLVTHPAYATVQASYAPTDAGNVLEQVTAAQGNVDVLADLIRRFEAGELLNCEFNGYAMMPFEFNAEQLAAGAEIVKAAAQNAGVATGDAPDETVRFCLSATPVSVDDLQAFKATLKARQQDIMNEIDVVQPQGDGSAANISFWLAERFAEYVGDGAEEPVCVASAYATVLSSQAGRDDFGTGGRGEIFGDNCGEAGAVGKRLVLYGLDSNSPQSGCVSVNSRQPDLTFRLAAGDICN